MNKPWINKEMDHRVQKLNKQYYSKKKRKMKKNIVSQHSQSLVRSLIVKTPFSIVSNVSNFLNTLF